MFMDSLDKEWEWLIILRLVDASALINKASGKQSSK